jgi:hypothetical protein
MLVNFARIGKSCSGRRTAQRDNGKNLSELEGRVRYVHV